MRSAALAVDRESVRIGDTLFTVCPWWDGPHTRVGIERMRNRIAPAHRPVGMGVSRTPTVLSWTGKRHYGDAVLPGLIQRHSPSAVLCGHIHEAPFKSGGSWVDRIGDTWLFNAGHQIGDIPARVEIDFTSAGRALDLARRHGRTRASIIRHVAALRNPA